MKCKLLSTSDDILATNKIDIYCTEVEILGGKIIANEEINFNVKDFYCESSTIESKNIYFLAGINPDLGNCKISGEILFEDFD